MCSLTDKLQEIVDWNDEKDAGHCDYVREESWNGK